MIDQSNSCKLLLHARLRYRGAWLHYIHGLLDIASRSNQECDDLFMPLVDCDEEGRDTIISGLVDIASRGNQECDDLFMSMLAYDTEGCSSTIHGLVDIASRSNKECHGAQHHRAYQAGRVLYYG